MFKFIYLIFTLLRRTCQRLFNFSSVGVKALVINSRQEVLLIEHTYIDGWHLPGGGLARHETPKAAIIRELREETGVLATGEVHVFGIYSHQIMGADDYPILYIIKSFEIPLHRKPCREIKQVGWFPLNSLPSGTSPETLQRIQEYVEARSPSEYW